MAGSELYWVPRSTLLGYTDRAHYTPLLGDFTLPCLPPLVLIYVVEARCFLLLHKPKTISKLSTQSKALDGELQWRIVSSIGVTAMPHRVVRTCVDCFRRGKEKLHSIRYFVYGAPRVGLLLKKSGTCTTLESSRTADDVVWEAYELFWKQGFGEYNLRSNNCEHFATFCRTGKRECTQMSFYNDLEEWFKSLIS
ncbi:hypothetical protein CRG98_047448 [Punica granatum]|uniref:LRAT domain-containing protein n=1 Tax=Punica granatum TaxID=22663 RepID=A0A2I0HKY1_PUNGR|nr:hypothetical protein CRG98_047448 [Punica granatum]